MNTVRKIGKNAELAPKILSNMDFDILNWSTGFLVFSTGFLVIFDPDPTLQSFSAFLTYPHAPTSLS